MKKFILVALVFCMLFTIIIVNAENSALKQPTISIDGKLLETSIKPNYNNGQLSVPFRAIFEKLGAKVDWDSKTNIVTGIKEDKSISIDRKNNIVSINGKSIVLDSKITSINGTTFVPAQLITDFFGCKVDWDEKLYSVNISSDFKVLNTVAKSATTIEVNFSSPVDKDTAKNIQNYMIYIHGIPSDKLNIAKVDLDETNTKAIITTSDSQSQFALYDIVIEGIKGFNGKTMDKISNIFASVITVESVK